MADDKTATGDPDRQRIALKDDYEVRDWSQKFGVAPEVLRGAARAIGNQAADGETDPKEEDGAV